MQPDQRISTFQWNIPCNQISAVIRHLCLYFMKYQLYHNMFQNNVIHLREAHFVNKHLYNTMTLGGRTVCMVWILHELQVGPLLDHICIQHLTHFQQKYFTEIHSLVSYEPQPYILTYLLHGAESFLRS